MPSLFERSRRPSLLGRIRAAWRRRVAPSRTLGHATLAEASGAAVVRLDFKPSDIWLYVTTDPERRWRAKACAKEPWTVDWLLRDVRRGEVLYDIGANVGAFSLIAAKHVGAHVVAFEPGYANFARLCDNIQLNECTERIVPLPTALAERAELVGFEYRTVEPGQSRHQLTEARWSVEANDGEKYVQPAATMPLDDVIADYDLPVPNHLKIDVDGAELRVLRGARRLLGRAELRTVLIEAAPALRDAVQRLMEEAGLRLRADLRLDQPHAPGYALFERAHG
jgi:FkbM family methyltransferase